jgi:hypothetical protein
VILFFCFVFVLFVIVVGCSHFNLYIHCIVSERREVLVVVLAKKKKDCI